ncbi:MAG: hypothetical protein QGI78_02070 [Phycisphaerales bacterium]|jgi:hypothetical protein|nr:hypothetical protein [Phycisphaerales bacterium]
MAVRFLLYPVVLFLICLQASVGAEIEQITVLREGSTILNATATLELSTVEKPASVTIVREDGTTANKLILFPNQRVAEMESEEARAPKSTFQLSGEIFTFDLGNFLLVREVTRVDQFASRDLPDHEPLSPDIDSEESRQSDDSIESIIADLEEATGSLNKSIRSAANNPIDQTPSRDEGIRVTNRRGHLVRNTQGAWIFVFVADSSGLSDPPCTVLPTTASKKLFKFASRGGYTIPVLVSGEILTYHGHEFLLVRSWRKVHKADHLTR